uniref:Dirigent protein n=1 Tax=Oryza barthii TaxID=65489 RepID=A0A0D3HFT5_9ORYZ
MAAYSFVFAAVAEAPTTNASATWFGTVVVIDNPLTDGPNLTSSRLVGRAQGMYVVAAGKDALSLMMSMNFVFADDGPYNGSSLAVFAAAPPSPRRLACSPPARAGRSCAWPPPGRSRV